MPQAQLDMTAFEAAYKAALPAEVEKVKARVASKTAGMAEPAMLFDTKAISLGSFCQQWTKVRGFLTIAISAVGWFMPGPAAMAKAFITAFESTVLPVVCPVPPAE